MTWRTQAVCLDADTALFMPAGMGIAPVEAMRYCRRCPVRRECLDEALTIERVDDAGVWGGTTARSREQIRAGRMAPEAAMAQGDRIARGRTDSEIAAETRASRSGAARRRLANRHEPTPRPSSTAAEDLESAHILIGIVAGRHGLTADDLCGRSNRPKVAAARQEAMREVRAGTRLTVAEIGEVFGRHRNTVNYAIAKAAR